MLNILRKLFHRHRFSIKDVMNLKDEPICSCGKTLTELSESKNKKTFYPPLTAYKGGKSKHICKS